MIHKVISGGQTGVDMAGLKAAKSCRIATGGWAPKGYLTERGPRPTLLRDVYGLEEHPSPKYPPRTWANIEDADLTLVIAKQLNGGSKLTVDMCRRKARTYFHITDLSERRCLEVFNWICLQDPHTVNVAGNRESKSPGIEASAFLFLKTLFTWFNQPTWRN